MDYRFAKAAAVAVGLIAGAAATASADVVATSIPPSVQDVQTLGAWESDNAAGTYRIVITRAGTTPVTTRLYVQWLAIDDAGEASVTESIEIAELAEFGLDIVDYKSESDADGLTMYVKTLDPADGFDETYELFVFSPTEYIFGPASN